MKNKYYAISYKVCRDDFLTRLFVFSDRKALNNYLNTEEYDFRIREIITREEALEIFGEDYLKSAEMLDWFYNKEYSHG